MYTKKADSETKSKYNNRQEREITMSVKDKYTSELKKAIYHSGKSYAKIHNEYGVVIIKRLLSISLLIKVARETSNSSGVLISRLMESESLLPARSVLLPTAEVSTGHPHPCGTASISKTFLPFILRPTPRFNTVVDLPVPPF